MSRIFELWVLRVSYQLAEWIHFMFRVELFSPLMASKVVIIALLGREFLRINVNELLDLLLLKINWPFESKNIEITNLQKESNSPGHNIVGSFLLLFFFVYCLHWLKSNFLCNFPNGLISFLDHLFYETSKVLLKRSVTSTNSLCVRCLQLNPQSVQLWTPKC